MGRSDARDGKFKGAIAAAVLLVAGLAALAHAGLFDGLFGKSPPAGKSPADNAKAAGVVESADAVMIPLKALDSGKALFLVHAAGERDIHFFALKSSDGIHRAAFDACDICFLANEGYRQEGDLMVCNKCGQTFPSVKVNEIRGGCNPEPLDRRVEGDYLVIRKSDIEAGGDYFVRKRP
jgi:uncharacterized membrane protein